MGDRQPRLLDQVRDRIRRKHYSIRTEQAYVDWIRRFVLHHNKRHPRDMGAVEVEGFLTHLAVAKGCRPRRRTRPRVRTYSSKRRFSGSLPWVESILAHLSGTVGLMIRPSARVSTTRASGNSKGSPSFFQPA